MKLSPNKRFKDVEPQSLVDIHKLSRSMEKQKQGIESVKAREFNILIKNIKNVTNIYQP